MTIQTQKILKASMTADGPIHQVKQIGEDSFLILCRGFSIKQGQDLTFSNSKPTCKACSKVKEW